jgi:hypothetical protein
MGPLVAIPHEGRGRPADAAWSGRSEMSSSERLSDSDGEFLLDGVVVVELDDAELCRYTVWCPVSLADRDAFIEGARECYRDDGASEDDVRRATFQLIG